MEMLAHDLGGSRDKKSETRKHHRRGTWDIQIPEKASRGQIVNKIQRKFISRISGTPKRRQPGYPGVGRIRGRCKISADFGMEIGNLMDIWRPPQISHDSWDIQHNPLKHTIIPSIPQYPTICGICAQDPILVISTPPNVKSAPPM